MVQVFQHSMNGGPPVGEPTAYVGKRGNGGLIQFFQIGALVVQVQDGVVSDAGGGHAARAHLAHADAVSVPATGEDHLKNIAVGAALRQALGNRQPATGVLHHSDQDGLYACGAYYDLLTAHGFVISNSRRGNCYDNACVESFFARLKTECLPPSRYVTRAQAEMDVFRYVEVFYNRVRRHSTLNYLSPVDFELLNHQP